jgi:enoyl-CoA hydratase/carnithine racemase
LTKDELLALPRTAAFPEGELTERLIAETQGPVGWLVFNNPAHRNAISVDMWEQIPKVIERYELDPAIRVIVLRGAGDKAFVSGADISQFERERSGTAAVQHYEEIAEGAQLRLQASDKPTLAMIRGYCLGAGVNIATACDLRIAAEDARFGIPAARVGLGYRVSATRNLLDTVGAAYAREMLITARQFSAAEAGAMGLAQRVVAVAALEDCVLESCAEIAGNAPLTQRTAKRILRELLRLPRDFDAAACAAWVRECFDSADYKEGRRAFMEKRKPVFSGR